MHPLLQQIANGRALTCDGPWGTQLLARGLQLGEPAPLWNQTHPHVIQEIALAYAAAGADILTTNTFTANRFLLASAGLQDQVPRLNELGARIVRDAAPHGATVLGCIGPTAVPASRITTQARAIRDAYLEQVSALLAGGCDGVLIETISHLDEAAIAIDAALSAGAPLVACSFTFRKCAAGYQTLSGNSPLDAFNAAAASGAHIVGLNCMQDPLEMTALLGSLDLSVIPAPLIARPNAGQPPRYGATPAHFAQAAAALRASRVAIIGACCGAGPEHIRAISATLNVKQ